MAIQKNFLTQHVHNPTRCRGSNEPSILDLMLTDVDWPLAWPVGQWVGRTFINCAAVAKRHSPPRIRL